MSFGQLLIIVLIVVGILFLFIQFVALIFGLALARSITGSIHELFVGTVQVQKGDFSHKIEVEGARPAGRAGQLVQHDDQPPDVAAGRDGREEAAGRGAAHRARHPDVAAAAGPAAHAGPADDGALFAGARGGRRLLRLFRHRRPARRHPHRRRLGQGHLGRALHGRAQGPDAVAEPDPHLAARADGGRQPHHRRQPRRAQLHHDDLRRARHEQRAR